MMFLWFIAVSQLGMLIGTIYTLREHRKMLAILGKFVKAHHEVLIKGESK